jgi:hypothetical protein
MAPTSALVAQLDRASDFDSEGREFESLRARHRILLRPRPGSDETIFRIDEKLWKQIDSYAAANKDKGGVMDFVAAFLALISIGVFAAHTLDAIRAD